MNLHNVRLLYFTTDQLAIEIIFIRKNTIKAIIEYGSFQSHQYTAHC